MHKRMSKFARRCRMYLYVTIVSLSVLWPHVGKNAENMFQTQSYKKFQNY